MHKVVSLDYKILYITKVHTALSKFNLIHQFQIFAEFNLPELQKLCTFKNMKNMISKVNIQL